MGIEARFVVTITKTCDGCGDRWSATQSFRHVGAVLAFGGPAEAAAWEICVAKDGSVQLLCDKCAAHQKGNPQP